MKRFFFGIALVAIVFLVGCASFKKAAQKEGAETFLILAADMVRGHTNPIGPVCALNSRYKRGEMVVWRVRIFDSETGKAIPAPVDELLAKKPGKEDLAGMSEGISVEVHLSDGQTFPMHFG